MGEEGGASAPPFVLPIRLPRRAVLDWGSHPSSYKGAPFDCRSQDCCFFGGVVAAGVRWCTIHFSYLFGPWASGRVLTAVPHRDVSGALLSSRAEGFMPELRGQAIVR